MIRIIQCAYENNKSHIWDESTFSEPFSFEHGVKQGCILSRLLFSLYAYDLADELPHGVNVADTNVKND